VARQIEKPEVAARSVESRTTRATSREPPRKRCDVNKGEAFSRVVNGLYDVGARRLINSTAPVRAAQSDCAVVHVFSTDGTGGEATFGGAAPMLKETAQTRLSK